MPVSFFIPPHAIARPPALRTGDQACIQPQAEAQGDAGMLRNGFCANGVFPVSVHFSASLVMFGSSETGAEGVKPQPWVPGTGPGVRLRSDQQLQNDITVADAR